LEGTCRENVMELISSYVNGCEDGNHRCKEANADHNCSFHHLYLI